ncbi:MAG: flagellar type III secretion system pore protein FliP [Planctomycetota bacterium]
MSARRLLPLALLVAILGLLAPAAAALQGDPAPPVRAEDSLASLVEELAPALGATDDSGATPGGVRMSTAIEIAVLLTVLTLLPAILITVTSFTRIVIVLSFVRRSLAVQELPPNPVVIGLALFLTTFVMGPVFTRIYETAYAPYRAAEIDVATAGDRAWGEMRTFLLANTRQSELELFAELAKLEPRADDGGLVASELPMRVVVPAFVLSELKTAFQMGFLLFLPFLVIDLVVASVLISMGMFMLPPIMISTPFKILLFVLVDGWHLVCESLVTSFIV